MRGHIRKRGDHSWNIIIDLGRRPDGRRLQRGYTVRGTKRDAERKKTQLLTSLDTATYAEPSRMTVAEFLERWLADYAKHKVSAKTFERYAEIVRRSLAPELGQHRLDKLQPLHIQAYYSKALQSGRSRGGSLSARTVLHHHRALHTALKHAVKWLLLARNPADSVDPPRPLRKEITALDEGGAAKLLEAAQGDRFYIPMLLAVTTGMRRGEIMALRWQDVDLEAAILAVRQSLEETKAGLAIKQPKTARSKRSIALPQMTVEALRQHKARQARDRLAIGPGYLDLGLVNAKPDGTPWKPSVLTLAFSALAKRLEKEGLPRITFHGLRHTHATLLLRANEHPKVVSERLGHSSVGITLDTYSHVLPGMQEEAARKIDGALRVGSRGSSEVA